MSDIAKDLGPLLLGGLIALGLSGIVTMQAFLYFRTFKTDYTRVKVTVGTVWTFDLIHAALVCAANWRYLIEAWGNDAIADFIPVSVSLTIVVTPLSDIASVSKNNWLVSLPMFLLAGARLISAVVCTILMIRYPSYKEFVRNYDWIFTIGLSTSVVLDFCTTASLCYYLRNSRTGFTSMDFVIDTILLYTINNGVLTCISTIISLVCWIVMPQNLVFLGFHFAISKLYANSFLATLNTRDSLRERSQGSSERGHQLPVIFPNRHTSGRMLSQGDIPLDGRTTKLQINVEKTIQCEVDGELEEMQHTP
ncbi:hypothetical protein JAAARDRAFT_199358 [Jaapia argillacea MUCL 33604]|uniref:DUF6534 domain-containing protein n=1 Tax=Jaapia argillacea MUCL 33604 TaxID=933084 RepID=A0A067PBD2_9AGAM|nr:hypothetical protein JAAARDRAFT_199358 [Jaapia argillacea MUCL 33604]